MCLCVCNNSNYRRGHDFEGDGKVGRKQRNEGKQLKFLLFIRFLHFILHVCVLCACLYVYTYMVGTHENTNRVLNS